MAAERERVVTEGRGGGKERERLEGREDEDEGVEGAAEEASARLRLRVSIQRRGRPKRPSEEKAIRRNPAVRRAWRSSRWWRRRRWRIGREGLEIGGLGFAELGIGELRERGEEERWKGKGV